MKAINIEWDLTDDVVDYNIDDCDVPTEVDIPNDIKEEDVADYLSNEYGFCVESFQLVKPFDELTKEELWKLREEVIIGSLFISSYTNSFGYRAVDISHFFDGYCSYIEELMEEDKADDDEFENYDNADNLLSWFYCCEDYSWIRYEEQDNEPPKWWEY